MASNAQLWLNSLLRRSNTNDLTPEYGISHNACCSICCYSSYWNHWRALTTSCRRRVVISRIRRLCTVARPNVKPGLIILVSGVHEVGVLLQVEALEDYLDATVASPAIRAAFCERRNRFILFTSWIWADLIHRLYARHHCKSGILAWWLWRTAAWNRYKPVLFTSAFSPIASSSDKFGTLTFYLCAELRWCHCRSGRDWAWYTTSSTAVPQLCTYP